MPSSECYEVIQDRQGYIWIATDNGVSRFDGYEFKNFGPKEGLLDRTVLFMHEDHRGWIWMSTFSGNFYIYRADTIAAYPQNEFLTNLRAKYTSPHDFIIDTKGRLHVALQGYGIVTIDSTGAVKEYMGNQKYPFRYGQYLLSDKYLSVVMDPLILISNPIGIEPHHSIKGKKQLPFHIIDQTQRRIVKLEMPEFGFKKNSRHLSCYNFRNEEGIFVQFLNYFFWYDHNYQLKAYKTLDNRVINCIKLFKDGSIAIGFFDQGGLDIYPSVNSIFERNSPQKQSLLPNLTVSHILQDRAGSLWITTTEEGLFFFPYQEARSLSIKSESTAPSTDQNFVDITPSKYGFYCLTNQGVIYEVDKNLKLRRTLTVPRTDKPTNLITTTDGALYVNSPVFQYNNGDKWDLIKVPLFDSWDSISESVPDEYENILDLIKYDANRQILWGVTSNIIYSYNTHTKENNTFNFHGHFPEIPQFTTIHATIHQPGLWLGSNKGLFLYEKNTKKLKPILPKHPLLQTRIRCIYQLDQDRILIGTQKAGLLLLDRIQSDSLQLTPISELSPSPVLAISYQAENDYVWITTPQGIVRYGGNTLHEPPIIFQSLRIAENKLIKLIPTTDYLFILSVKQITRFPLDLSLNQLSMPLRFTKAQFGNTSILNTTNSELPFNSTLNLQFTTFDYLNAPNINYRYRLLQTDEWLTTTNREVLFSNLSPGFYHFEVQAQNSLHKWSPSTTLPFRILPPFWQRWWFWLLIILFLGAGVYSLIRSRFTQLQAQQQQQKLQLQLERIQQQAYQAQMNPHFIFNSLNAIQGFILGDQHEQRQAVNYLAKFSILVRKALNYSSEGQIPLTEDIEMIQEYLALEKMRFGTTFDYQVKVDILDSEAICIPPMLVQPLVENAILHGLPKSKTGKIEVTYTQKENALSIAIKDNGPGYKVAQKRRHEYRTNTPKGLRITRERLKLLNDPNQIATLNLDEYCDEHGQIRGTLVTLKLPLDR